MREITLEQLVEDLVGDADVAPEKKAQAAAHIDAYAISLISAISAHGFDQDPGPGPDHLIMALDVVHAITYWLCITEGELRPLTALEYTRYLKGADDTLKHIVPHLPSKGWSPELQQAVEALAVPVRQWCAERRAANKTSRQ